MRAWSLALLLLVGCEAHLGGNAGGGGGNANIDASSGGGGGGGSGSNAGGGLDAGSGASATCSNGRVLFLEFEGATLTQATTASDATTNKAVWLGVGSATLPRFRPNANDRATQIADTVTAIKTALAGFPDISVVTTRPAAGPYFMIGFGGAHQTANVPYTYAVDRLDCNDAATKSDVAWVFEAAENPQRAANFAIGSLLFGLGATGTTDPNDCMCGWLTNCQANDTACTISTSITAASGCNATNPVNETTFLNKFCN